MGPEVRPAVPWQIETDPGQDYVLSLLDAGTQAAVLTVYLHGGEPYRGLAPEGAFDLTYTVGPHWLGPGRGFKGGSSVVRASQTYLVQIGPDDAWVWRLRLHPNGCDGSAVAPVAPLTTLPLLPSSREVPAAPLDPL
ncbi:hypothetical protein [Geothrix paludis]|uniref:hypothetical protein n=1 Tax=Geothrix paludis TaxID=2922722 RepID=UPI001FAB8046|nr:hypothetical protein [Geothrix paludis]